jgi:hypothetical protein
MSGKDPGPSIEEIILTKWEHEWDEKLKAHIQRIADEMGCTWWDVVMDCRDLFFWTNPITIVKSTTEGIA